MLLSGLEAAHAWLKPLVAAPWRDIHAPRPRPLVYVYDMPAQYVTRMLQYRVDKGTCFWRRFQADNSTAFNQWSYMVESLFHELLLQVQAVVILRSKTGLTWHSVHVLRLVTCHL